MMLPKANRITENREFLRIFKTVRPMHTEHLTFRIAKRNPNFKTLNPRQFQNKNDQKMVQGDYCKEIVTPSTMRMARNDNNFTIKRFNNAPSRFGFVISNKIDKRATRRNALKRRIRAVIEDKLAQISEGLDMVIQVKKPFDYPYDYQIIKDEVLSGLIKLGIVKREDNNPL